MAISYLALAAKRSIGNNCTCRLIFSKQPGLLKCHSGYLSVFSSYFSSGPNVYGNLDGKQNHGDSVSKSHISAPGYSLYYQTTEVLSRMKYKEFDRFQSDIFTWLKSRSKSRRPHSLAYSDAGIKNETTDFKSASSNVGLVVGGSNSGKTSSYLLALLDVANDPSSELFKLARDNHRNRMMVYGSLRGSKTFVLKKLRRMKGVPKFDWNAYVVPMAVVLVPFRELGLNIFEFCSKIGLRSRLLAGGKGYKKQSGVTGLRVGEVSKSERENVDVVIATPEMFLRSLNGEFEDLKIDVALLRFLVFEESDLLSEPIYLDSINQAMNIIYNHRLNMLYVTRFKTDAIVSNIQQLVLTSSDKNGPLGLGNKGLTEAENNFQIIEKSFVPDKDVKKIFIHALNNDRLELLIDVLNELNYAAGTKAEKTIVYCNNIKCNKFLRYSLLDRGFNVANLFGDMNYEERTDNLKKFETNSNILIATSFATRFKLPCTVKNVLVFDFPKTLNEYTLYLSNLSHKNSKLFMFFNNRNLGLIKEIQAFSKEFDKFEFRNLTPKLSKKLYLNQKEILKQLKSVVKVGKKKVKLTSLKNLLSPKNKRTMKKFYLRTKAMKKVEFLRKRGILKKDQGLPKMPDRNMEASDSQEYIRMHRSPDGFLQFVPKRRSRVRTHKDENDYDPESVIIPGAPTYQSEPLGEKKHHLNTHF